MRTAFLLLFLSTTTTCFSQVDTNYLKNLYDRCLDFSEEKVDSVKIYAEFIDKTARELKFIKGDVLSLRLKGYFQELKTNYEEAISFYLQSLEAARKIRTVEYEISALSDLAIIYSYLKNPLKAKEFYLQCAALVAQRGDIGSMVSTYTNLGVIYNHLGMYDSALYVLNEGLRIGKPHESRLDLSSLYNNLGNVYFRKKQYDLAYYYFKNNYEKHIKESDLANWWIDNLNIADVFIEKKQYDSAQIYADKALRLAVQLDAKSKESDSYSLLAKLNEKKGNYRQAYDYLQKWYAIDTALLSRETYQNVAVLQEKFDARYREAQNKLLKVEIDRQRARSRELATLAITLAISGVLAAIAFVTKRNANRRLKATNDLVVKQNDKLEELHYEKNSLIGIVSHDLSTPFATIKMWGQLLQADKEELNEEQKKAVARILQASEYGDQFIRSILDVEKADIGNHKIHLENFNLNAFALETVDDFRAAASKKNINVHMDMPGTKVFLMSDKQLVGRIISNLLSNAIKYTPGGRNVWFGITEEEESVTIRVKDEGVGIKKEELPYLFSKYSKISSVPTNGEPSTGLGLSIVKKLAEELNGRIYCESEPGNGSVFYVVMAK